MTLKDDAKFEEKLNCGLVNDMRNMANFHQSNLKSHDTCHDSEEWCKIWRGIDLSIQNWHEEFDEFDPSTWKSQKFSF